MAEAPFVEQTGVWSEMITVNSRESLAQMVEKGPVMLVFLRHFGCSFCREAISDIKKRRRKIEAKGVRIVLVHMANDVTTAEQFFRRYKLSPIDHIADPDKRFYRDFGLLRCSPAQLLGFMNWVRGFQAGVLEGHGFAYQSEDLGDGFQMPGVFILHQGKIKHSFIHKAPYDRPDYEAIVGCCAL